MRKPIRYYIEYALVPPLFFILLLDAIREAFYNTLEHVQEHKAYYSEDRTEYNRKRLERLNPRRKSND